MTKDQALKMAIKTAKTAIKEWQKLVDDLDGKAWRKINELEEKLDDCKDVLEQPAQEPEYVYVNPVTKDMYYLTKAEQPAQEPVAWIKDWADGSREIVPANYDNSYPVYTNPAPSWQGNKEFVGLSDDELAKIIGKGAFYEWNDVEFARAIEQALKEKNNAV
jgi:hypothetical protein